MELTLKVLYGGFNGPVRCEGFQRQSCSAQLLHYGTDGLRVVINIARSSTCRACPGLGHKRQSAGQSIKHLDLCLSDLGPLALPPAGGAYVRAAGQFKLQLSCRGDGVQHKVERLISM